MMIVVVVVVEVAAFPVGVVIISCCLVKDFHLRGR